MREPKMSIFTYLGDKMDKMLSLADPDEEEVMEKPDRVVVSGTPNMTTVDQSAICAAVTGAYTGEPLLSSTDVPGSVKTQGEKYYLVDNRQWTQSRGVLQVLQGTGGGIDVVAQLYNADLGSHGLMEYHTYARFGIDLVFQINPTSFQQGGLLACMVPAHIGVSSWASATTWPHVLLNCNINNMGRITVPWVYTRGAYNIHNPIYTPWRLYFFVWSPLQCSSDTTQEVTVVTLGRFTDLQLHGIRPNTNMMRTPMLIDASSFAVNLCNYQGSGARMNMGLGDEHFRSDQSMSGSTAVTNLRSWIEIPCLAGTFQMRVADAVGTQLVVIPVNPYLYTLNFKGKKQWESGSEVPIEATTNICSVAANYMYWRGNIVYHFQVYCTKYHSGRIIVGFMPGNEDTDVSRLTLKKLTTCQCAVLDLNGVMSTIVFRPPFVSDTQYKTNLYTHTSMSPDVGSSSQQNAVNWRKQHGLYCSTGKIVVMVYSKLTCPGNVMQHVNINWYISGTNMEFMGPTYKAVRRNANYTSNVGEEEEKLDGDGVGFSTSPVVEQNPVDRNSIPDFAKNETGPPLGVGISMEDPKMLLEKPRTFSELAPGISRHVVDHLDIYELMGRAHLLTQFEAFNQTVDKWYSIPLDVNCTKANFDNLNSTLRWFFSMIHLYRGPIDVSIVWEGSSNVDGMMWFVPWGGSYPDHNTQVDTKYPLDMKTAYGVVRFNSALSQCVKVRIPYYTCLSAVSSAMPKDVKDSCLGTLCVQINNFRAADEKWRATVYVSIPKEAQCMFMRACPSFTLLGNSSFTYSAEEMRRQTLVESSVDPIDDEENVVDKPIPPQRPYRDLRMEVGRKRLELAFKEWREGNKDVAEKILTQSGNQFVDGVLVFKQDGTFRLKGIYFNMKILYFSCPKPFRMIPVMRHGGFHITKDLKGWTSEGVTVDLGLVVRLMNCPKILDLKANWLKMLGEDKFQAFSPEDVDMMCKLLGSSDFQLLCELTTPLEIHLVDRVVEQTEIGGGLKNLLKDSKVLAAECTGLLSSVNVMLNDLKSKLPSRRFVWVSKLLLSLAKVALSFYACHACDWQIGVVAPILSIAGLSAIGSFCDLFSKLRDILDQGVDKEICSQSADLLREVSTSVTLFKNLKDLFSWLVNYVKDAFDKKNQKNVDLLVALDDNRDEIETLLSEVDDFILLDVKSTEKVEKFHQGNELLRRLRVLMGVNAIVQNRTFGLQLRDAGNNLVNKLRGLGEIVPVSVARHEPVVLYAYGDKGTGKSLLTMAVAAKLSKKLGYDLESGVYTKPVNSDYFDGYCGQPVLIMDDIGQNSDDSDWAYFCQLVSTCPFKVNMAELSEKGRSFTSPFILCSSNLVDPTPKTVYCMEAIRRRLEVKVKVEVKKEFQSMHDGTLNMAKAKRSDALRDLSCLVLTYAGDEITLDELVEVLINRKAEKEQNFRELMEIWSQSDSTPAAKLREALGVVAKPCKHRMFSLWDWIANHKLVTCGSTLAIVAGLVALGLGCYFTCKRRNQRVTEDGAYNSSTVPKRVVRLNSEVVSQSILEMSCMIHKSLCRFGVGFDEESVVWRVNCLALVGEWLLVPKHALAYESRPIRFVYVQKGPGFYCSEMEHVQIVEFEHESDLLLLRFTGMPKARDIRGHFPKRDEVSLAVDKVGTLCTINGGVYQMIGEGKLSLLEKAQYSHRMEDGTTKLLTVAGVWRGAGEAMEGSCGGVVVSSNTKLSGTLVGIHVASGNGIMLSESVCREQFDVCDKIFSQCKVLSVKCCDKSVFVNSQTQFKKSPIQEMLQHDYKVPALMPYRGEVDVFSLFVDKYSGKPVDPVPNYEETVAEYEALIESDYADHGPPLSEYDAIMGVEGMDSIDMTTSPGLPYSMQGLGKRDLIDNGVVVHSALRDRLDISEQLVLEGRRLECEFNVVAKDELRPMDKVIEGKTRSIDVCPVHVSILFRRIFGRVISGFNSKPSLLSSVAIGTDPDSDWHTLFMTLKNFGSVGIDLDFANFDASVAPWMMDAALWVFNRLGLRNQSVHKSLVQTFAYPKMRLGPINFWLCGTMPSGMPCTSLLNSLINVINFYWVFKRILQTSFLGVRDNVMILVYGDDALLVVREGVTLKESVVSQIQNEFGLLGFKCTGADKGPVAIKPLEELTFLKRHFGCLFGKIVPVIEERTIWSLLAWVRKGASFQDNIDNASWFAFLCGENFYSKFCFEVSGHLSAIGSSCVVKPFEHWKLRFKSLAFVRKW
uniref:Genome polyprotein n=1 Tax=Sphenifaro virus TaxID=2780019 RepID=A0AC59IBK0_9PICO|nr:MAG: Genome polyprotein [Sphenifaro virus]